MSSNPCELPRSIGFWSGTALVVGTMIGSGIFRTPASIATVMHDPRLIVGLWIFFGAVSLCGALTIAELATMLPETGGTYVYLRAAYGDAVAFVFGWLYLLVAIPSGVGAAAVFFSELVFSTAGVPLATASTGVPLVAVAAITFVSGVNIVGVRLGTALHNVLTVVKVAILAALIAGAWLFGQGDVARWWTVPATAGGNDFAAATKSVLYTYTGWVYVSLVAGEIRDPRRGLKGILLAGTGLVVLLYVAANLAYLYLIPLPAMPGTVVGREAMIAIAGPLGGTVVSACILASVFGGMNGIVLTKARVAYAQSRDGLSFAFLGRVHPRWATPYVSILIQGAGAIVLVLALREPLHPSRLFDRLTAYFVLVEWLALIFAIGAVFVLRHRRPDAARPYRVPGYPLVPLFFLVGTGCGLGAVLWSACARDDYSPLIGVGITLAGFPVYWAWRKATAAKLAVRAQPTSP